MELMGQLAPKLKSLRLSGILSTLEARNMQAIDDKLSYIDFLGRLLEDEVERRSQKQLALRLRRALLQSDKTIEGFDFNFNPQINRQKILDLACCGFVERKENVLICGPTGVGKTHLAQALGHEICRRGYDALFTSTHKMLTHLNGGRADGSYERRLATYLRPEVIILDDFCLRPLTPPAPEHLFDVISERYQRGSMILTSNRALTEWADLFGDPLLASAGLDRLAHNAHTLIITGPSYRAKGRTALGLLPE